MTQTQSAKACGRMVRALNAGDKFARCADREAIRLDAMIAAGRTGWDIQYQTDLVKSHRQNAERLNQRADF